MVISHLSRHYRGQPPDAFCPADEQEPSSLGRTTRWHWSDDPVWNVEVCRECDFTRGLQCPSCAAIRAEHRNKEDQ